MRLFDKMKQFAISATAVLAMTVLTAGSIEVQAKIINEPQQTSKRVTYVGNDFDVDNVANLKINGKKYNKGSMKKKVKTVELATNSRQYKAYTGSYTVYYDNSIVYDEEDAEQKKQNFKYIDTYNYSLTFLKPGTYKISYDRYAEGESEIVKSADKKTAEVTPVLEKTSYVATVKVLETTSAIKSVSLGKSKRTYTTKRSGTKTTSKTVVKNRYLSGKSGKFKISMNKNYKLTSAYVVTRDEAGNLLIAATGNNKTITYSTGKYTNTETYDKVVPDENGKDKYVVDADGYNKIVRAPVVVSESASKYKNTTIYYGYKNAFTGDYMNYSIGTKTVYIPQRDEEGDLVYQKDATGAYVRDENKERIPVVNAVQATTITEKYPTQTRMNGTYQIVEVVYEKVILPTDKTMNEGAEYWIDAKGKERRWSGSNELVSKGNIAYEIVLTDGTYRTNPAYRRAFYDDSYYAGTWVAYNENMKSNTYGDSIYDIDLTTGEDTTRWVYQYTLDAEGERVEKAENTNVVSGLGYSYGSVTFKAK